jgi:hypothetical protein
MCSRCRPTHKVRMQRRGVGDTVVIMALSVFMSCNSNNAADAATAVIAAQGATRALARRHTLLQFWRLFDEHTTTPTMNLLLAHPDRRPAAHAPHSAGGGKAPGPGNRRQKWPQQLLMMWTVLLLSLKGVLNAPLVAWKLCFGPQCMISPCARQPATGDTIYLSMCTASTLPRVRESVSGTNNMACSTCVLEDCTNSCRSRV